MIYSSVLVIEIVLYVMGDNAFYIVYDPIAQLTVSLYARNNSSSLINPSFDSILRILFPDREWYRL